MLHIKVLNFIQITTSLRHSLLHYNEVFSDEKVHEIFKFENFMWKNSYAAFLSYKFLVFIFYTSVGLFYG